MATGTQNACGLAMNSDKIEYMILLHDSFKEDEKPQWLSLDEILDYQRECLSLSLDMRDAAAASMTVAAFDDDFRYCKSLL